LIEKRTRTLPRDTAVVASANLRLARSIFAAWERGDFGSNEWADPEIELVFADGPQRTSWKGVGAMRKAFFDFLRNWDDWRALAEEYRELDEERVLVLLRNTGRGKTSGMDVSQLGWKAAILLRIRSGKVVELVGWGDRDRALADLGLAPESDSRASA
jgi:ketosteroid isomerase-like protein